ncbi:Uncharacterised protein g5136 [Pycnogonum litorale]
MAMSTLSNISKQFAANFKQNGIRSFIHIVVTAVAVIGLGYSVFEITVEYHEDDNIASVIRMSSGLETKFPAITMCSTAPYKCSKVVESPKISKVLTTGECTDYLDSKRPIIWREDITADYGLYNKSTIKHKYEDILNYFSFDMDRDEIKSLTSSYNEFIEKCFFDAKTCNESDFLVSFISELGHCYTFNSAWKSTPNGELIYVPKSKIMLWSHSNTAFSVQFKINHSEVIPLLSNGIGLHIMIHDRHHRPANLHGRFVTVEPRKHSSVGIRKTIIERHGTSNCRNDYDHEIKEMFKMNIEKEEKYDSLKCQQFVMQKTAVEKCNCRMNSIIGYENFPDIVDCGYKDSCVGKISWTNHVEHICEQPCTKETFDMRVTSKSMPTPRKRFKDQDKMGNVDDIDGLQQYSTGWVNIFYETPVVTHYTEIQRITFVAMIGNYGGYVGLFVGVSVLSALKCMNYTWKKMPPQQNTKLQELKTEEDED